MSPVTSRKPIIAVVAAALIDDGRHILVQQRPPGKSLAGLWEFPGGKIETGERPEEALARELHEELGIVVHEADLSPGPFVSAPIENVHLLLVLYLCERWQGVPQPHHATALGWHSLAGLRTLAMPPADLPLLDRLAAFMPPIPSS